MRGAKIDIPATRIAFTTGEFKDKRSFISTKGSQYLHGEDIGRVRAQVMERDKWRCRECGILTSDDYFSTHPCKAELDHIKNKPWERTDDLSNLRCMCHKCHGMRHGRW
jgi:hypothetical protein